MGQQVLSYSVETFSRERPNGHRLGDFRRLPVAIAAAKKSLDDERVTLAVVKDRQGMLVYAADNRYREYIADDDMGRVS